MQRVLTVQQMQECDAEATRIFRISGKQLMESAGKGITDFLHREFGPLTGKNIVVVCGKGNNGGDGFVIARHCSSAGAVVSVVSVELPSKHSPDAFSNYETLLRLQKKTLNGVRIVRLPNVLGKKVEHPDIVIDALLGTGFSGTVRPLFKRAIEWMNAVGCPVVSVDIPSGVNGTTGVAASAHVRAGYTLTLGALKTGLLLNDGMESAGRIEIVNIGLPPSLLEAKEIQTFRMSPDRALDILPRRSPRAHKYSVGKLLIVAGSKQYTGAAALCAQSALRSGAGAVVLAIPQSIRQILAKKLTETILLPVDETPDGSISLSAMNAIRSRIAWCDALLLGPGLSQNDETYAVVESLVKQASKPLVLDADALNALSVVGPSLLKKARVPIVLTPHTGEFARLTNLSSKTIEENRIEAARSFALTYKVTVVLKGAPTVTASADGRVVVNASGNPGMATIGSGDVLAGLLGGLIAQHADAPDAAACAAYLHGLAGDSAAMALGEHSLLASDILDHIPQAFSRIRASA